jgi:hypothetical protein
METHQLVKHIMTYKEAQAKVMWKMDHEYATVSSSLSQTLASPLFERLSSLEIVAVINTEFVKRNKCQVKEKP